MRTHLPTSLRVVTAAAALAALPLGVAQAQTRVQILHASDLEGGVDAIDAAPRFAAIVEALEADAADQQISSLLLSAGDNYIPGPFYSAAGDFSLRAVLRDVLGNPDAREGVGRVDVAIMNVLGFDASAIGNHEFDPGTNTMEGIIGPDVRDADDDGLLDQPRWLGVDFPYLSSNLDFANDGNLAGLFTDQILPSSAFLSPLGDLAAAAAAPKIAPAVIVERGGERFGVVGATTPLVESISSPGDTAVKQPGAGTNDMAALASILQPVIDAVALETDKIVLVTHLQQIALEQELIGLLSGVDVVIAGGSDTLLADATDVLQPGDAAADAYPLVTSNLDGDPALIVSTAGEYSYVGRLVVDFDAQGRVVPSSVVAAESGVFASNDATVDSLFGPGVDPFADGTRAARVRQLTDAVSDVVIQKDSAVFGKASVFLEGRREFVRTEETNLGNLTADANLFVARQVDGRVQVSIKNGGGIRAEIGAIDGITGDLLPNQANPVSGKQAGEISQLDIENTLRFNNDLTLQTLTREQLRAVLEHAVAAWEPGATPGQFGQFSGILFSFDPSRPAGDRIRTAGLITPGQGNPFVVFGGETVPGRSVRVVTLGFLANGGDGYPFDEFAAADPVLADRVDLEGLGLPVGAADFAAPGTEQDAMAEWLVQKYSTEPFDQAESAIDADPRIQNLLFQADTVRALVIQAINQLSPPIAQPN